jgi:hypothetical protein
MTPPPAARQSGPDFTHGGEFLVLFAVTADELPDGELWLCPTCVAQDEAS